ncbi:hypothetical protein [Borreliella lanei]|uniref:Uncharacterized protein n=1 Tax=Borreliella lanei TaxID=373540 RepID=A0A7W9ZBN7_9SPIR|nr:hypothetical protein [Borreliella lanei]MBB6208523.1 hypothetical protein [Borreliella lanei]
MAKDSQLTFSSGENDTVKIAVEIGVTKTLVVLINVLKYSFGVIIENLLNEVRKIPLLFGVDVEQCGYQ